MNLRSIARRDVLCRVAAAAALAAPPLVRVQSTVKIGLTLPLSGLPRQDNPLVSYLAPDLALDFLAAFQAAVELERRGEPITVVALDDEFKPDKARANVEALARQDVVAVSGVWTTEQARAVLPTLEAANLPLVGLRSTALELRRHPLLWHLRAGLDDETAAIVQTMKAAGYARWGVVHSDSTFGRGARGQPVYAGFAVASPYPNPATSRSAVARRFVDAMVARELDHATRSFSAFEGFVYGSVIARAITGVKGVARRESLAAALRGASFDLGGLTLAFDERQVGSRRMNLLYKSSIDWTLRA
jgi:ABC-type branched-subunit amino acid transport system substrate-binding protein